MRTRQTMAATARRNATTSMTAATSISSAPGDARNDHDLLGSRIEAVDPFCRSSGPHPERRGAPGALLGEDPLRLPHGLYRLGFATLDGDDVPFERGVALSGQNP